MTKERQPFHKVLLLEPKRFSTSSVPATLSIEPVALSLCHPGEPVDSFGLFVFCISNQLYFKRPQNRHPERSASQIYRKQRALCAESKTPAMLVGRGSWGLYRELQRKIKKSQALTGAEAPAVSSSLSAITQKERLAREALHSRESYSNQPRPGESAAASSTGPAPAIPARWWPTPQRKKAESAEYDCG